MPSKPPFYAQETPDSCVPACLRMVLAVFGIEVEEEELRARCDCTLLGTDAVKTVEAARRLGFAGTAKHTISYEELQGLVTGGYHPIVFVDMRPIYGSRGVHAMVVIGIDEQHVVVLDPLKGEHSLPLQSFTTAWAMRHNLAIIVER